MSHGQVFLQRRFQAKVSIEADDRWTGESLMENAEKEEMMSGISNNSFTNNRGGIGIDALILQRG